MTQERIDSAPIQRTLRSNRWLFAAGVIGLILYPLLWGLFQDYLPYREGFSDGVRGYSTVVAWIVFAVFWYCLSRAGYSLSSVGFPVRWKWWQLALVIFTVALALLLAVAAAFSTIGSTSGAADTQSSWSLSGRLTWVLISAPTAAIVEETIFRGFALTYLPEVLGGRVWLAVIVAGVIFAAGHMDFSISSFGSRFLLAVGFSSLFLWRKSLMLPFLLHWLINALGATIPGA